MRPTQPFSPILNQHHLPAQSPMQKTYTWVYPHLQAFDELLLSWNADRPLIGQYVILVSVYAAEWTPWLLYAVWGSEYQFSFHDTTSKSPVRSYQDQIELLEGCTATGFRIRLEACGGAALSGFYSLYACTSLIKSPLSNCLPRSASSLHLAIPGLSQLALNHPRSTSLCSPVSTTAAISYLHSHYPSDPLKFAKGVYDAGFDIYGNWSFNIAQAFVELGFKWKCWFARAAGFEQIWHYLKQGLPVVVSVKGFLTGSPLPYQNGHLIALKGYNPFKRKVLCMDPAFSSDEETHAEYCFDEFMQVWGRRRYLTYFFFPRKKSLANLNR